MATKKVRAKKPKEETVVQTNGKVEGQYSTSLWNNGELVSFDIDWDKLAAIVKSLNKTPAAT